MNAIINNKNIIIKNAPEELHKTIMEMGAYQDRSKMFKLKDYEKNPYLKNSTAYWKLHEQVHQNVVEYDESQHIYTIPAGFINTVFSTLPSLLKDITDLRCESGQKIKLDWKIKPFTLRDYQQEAINSILKSSSNRLYVESNVQNVNYRGIINIATGGGKTKTAIHLIKEISRKTLVICPSVNIARSFYDELKECFGVDSVGLYGNGSKDHNKDIVVGIAASISKNSHKFKDIGLIIFDENHRVAASTFYSIARSLGDVGRMYGLTATNFRNDGKDKLIEAGLGNILIKKDLIWCIDNDWLRRPTFLFKRVKTERHTSNIRNKIKEYEKQILNNAKINEIIINDINTVIKSGKSVLCLVNQIEHGNLLSEETGLPIASGKHKGSRALVDDLNNELIPGLIGSDKFIGEGVDTRNVDVLILANFIASKGFLWQNIGRGLRPFKDNKELLVIDYDIQNSNMMHRHAMLRLKYYKEITDRIIVK